MSNPWFPLEPRTPLTREQRADARRYKVVGRPELAGALWLPALVVLLTIAVWLGWSRLQMVVAAGLIFLGLCVFIFWRPAGRRSADAEQLDVEK